MLFKVYFNMQSDNEILNSIWKGYNNKNIITLSHFLSAFIQMEKVLRHRDCNALCHAPCIAKYKWHFNRQKGLQKSLRNAYQRIASGQELSHFLVSPTKY